MSKKKLEANVEGLMIKTANFYIKKKTNCNEMKNIKCVSKTHKFIKIQKKKTLIGHLCRMLENKLL